MEPVSNFDRQLGNTVPDSRRLVHRHLGDINDVITDEDIRSVKISSELPPFMKGTTATGANTQFDGEGENNS